MQMQEHYASAASRHVEDARYLCDARRWDNAGYLAGYVVECGVKAVINRAGSDYACTWTESHANS